MDPRENHLLLESPGGACSSSSAPRNRPASLLALALALVGPPVLAQDAQGPRTVPDPPEGAAPVHPVEGAAATTPEEMQDYRESIPGTEVTFSLKALPGGSFLFGSPEGEEDRGKDEGPQVEVRVSPFWIGTHEVTWAEYKEFTDSLDVQRRGAGVAEPTAQDPWSDAVSRPTPPYVPMDFNMGIEGYPAICMTQFAARQYTKWLSMKTGRWYRLPTEAEWEYACRAGTTTAWSFGDEVDDLEEAAWFFDNADDQYQKVGSLPPNPWGLYDMHGNVAEWCLDGYDAEIHGKLEAGVLDPVNWATELYPRVVRGGSWDHDPEDLRSAARMSSRAGWKVQDPQIPKSIWYHTDAKFLGFRVVRVLTPPTPEQAARWWEADLEEVRTIEQRQRNGDR